MANKITAVKIKIKDGVATAKMAFSHPMLTYDQAKAKTGNREDSNFITHITGKVKNKTVLDVSMSQFFLKIQFSNFNLNVIHLKLVKNYQEESLIMV